MTRIYENRGFATRMNISCVVIAGAVVFGLWELWTAYRTGGESSLNYMFALFFIGGAAFASKQIRDTSLDSVVSLDVDDGTGESEIVLWKPFSKRALRGPVAGLSDWQFQMRGGKNRVPLLTAHHPDHPRPLDFELRPGEPVPEGLRRLAPDAVAAYERALATPRP